MLLDIFAGVSPKTCTSCKLQSEKTFSSTVATLLGIMMLVSPEQPWNAFFLIWFTLLGMMEFLQPKINVLVDVLIIAGLVFVLMGLFASTASSQRIRIGIYCFFAGTIIDIVCVVWFLISGGSSVDQWLVNLLKAGILIALAYFLWRQSKNI